ncbi:M48 family metallopeptidase [Nitrincola sp. MINF-07-Sa-05]|uniref:M48 family metallopeptidase n=1 Tax=Nitrincola salilacus TaxID=3400273 RepID=UPI00391821CE
MNFFEQQDQARRNTKLLVLFFGLAIISLIIITTLAVGVVLYIMTGTQTGSTSGGALSGDQLTRALSVDNWALLSGVAAAVIAVVLLGSLFKRMQLSSGGVAVAEAMGGRLLNISTQDADEKRILNIVEEMALASGMPVPPVYIMEDDAINAFAAGYTPQDAVIGITRGCIRLLNRTELQGVVAHEFSHILHGDMRLNIRLVSLLNGILVIGLIGYFLLRSVRFQRAGSSRKGNSVAVVLALGACLAVVGYAGTFFGNLIKAAVSRQREYLADASAVQFTREPEGISGALKKIGGYSHGSQLSAANAAEFSHMFFGQGVKMAFGSLMATHPPLNDRIRRVEPDWDGRFVRTSLEESTAQRDGNQASEEDTQQKREQLLTGILVGTAATAASSGGLSSDMAGGMTGGAMPQHAARESIDAIGQPGSRHLAYAKSVLDRLDQQLYQAAHEPYSARAVIYGLLLSEQPDVRQQQLEALQQNALPDVFSELQRLLDKLVGLDPHLRLPLVELSLPALKQLTDDQYNIFKRCLTLLIRADNRVSLMEWALFRIVTRNIEGVSRERQRFDLVQCSDEIAQLLTLIAHAGNPNPEQSTHAYNAAVATLSIPLASIASRESVSLSELDKALSKLAQLKPLQKPALLKALAVCIEDDGEITITEAELLRAVADSLDCPLPPLLERPEG